MYRNYDEYLAELERMMRIAPKEIKLHKKSEEEFNRGNYKDKVEWYLMEEWNTDPFHEIFFMDCDMDSEETTPEQQRGYDLHKGVHNIMEKCYQKGMSVNQAAAKVYRYLKKKEAI